MVNDMPSSDVKAEENTGRTGKKASAWTNFLLLSAVTIITITLFELGLRVVDYNPIGTQQPANIVELRIQAPGSERMIDVSLLDPQHPQSLVRVDSRSYIRPSFQYSDPHLTIAFLGGSTTESAAVKESLRFPAVVSELFAAQKLKVNTLNAGRGGNTLHDSINILLNHVAFDAPDIVVVMNVANDIGILALRKNDYGMRSGRPLLFSDVVDWFKWQASEQLYLAGAARKALVVLRGRTGKAQPQALVDRIERTDPAFAATLPAHLYEQRLRVFVGVARGLGITPVLMTEPLSASQNELTPDWTNKGAQDVFNDIVRRVGKEEHVLVIDLVRYLRENVTNWDQPMNVFYDGIHVTDYGSKAYARHIVESLAPLARLIAAQSQESVPQIQ